MNIDKDYVASDPLCRDMPDDSCQQLDVIRVYRKEKNVENLLVGTLGTTVSCLLVFLVYSDEKTRPKTANDDREV